MKNWILLTVIVGLLTPFFCQASSLQQELQRMEATSQQDGENDFLSFDRREIRSGIEDALISRATLGELKQIQIVGLRTLPENQGGQVVYSWVRFTTSEGYQCLIAGESICRLGNSGKPFYAEFAGVMAHLGLDRR